MRALPFVFELPYGGKPAHRDNYIARTLSSMKGQYGDSQVLEMSAGKVHYVPPRWAHRSVNTSATEDLVMFFVYPGNAGHDYGTMEQKGFRKLVKEQNGKPTIIDNPR
ncbi:MAG: hypothetical protein JNL42_18595 [Anaerolineae bacterium]|nr:hypothetical protein [Anaerolineae bacterium]